MPGITLHGILLLGNTMARVFRCTVLQTFKHDNSSYDHLNHTYKAGDVSYFAISQDSWHDFTHDQTLYRHDKKSWRKHLRIDQRFTSIDDAIADAQSREPEKPDDLLTQKQAEIRLLLSEGKAEDRQTSEAIVTTAANFRLAAAQAAAGALSYQKKIQAHVKLLQALHKSKIQSIKSALEKKASAIQKTLQGKLAEMEEVMAKAKEALWTINLYLGVSEEIVMIRDGQPAGADVKIAMRQRILNMDEEAALEFSHATDSLDVLTIKTFDDWLLGRPERVARLVPEPKCVVGLHIRGRTKKYENMDPVRSAELNEQNLRSSFLLIRNGEQLYRIYIDITLGLKLFPTEDDVRGLTKKVYNDATQDWEEQPLDPKSEDFERAMETADADKKHYMRVLLVLQGLIDRTEVFRPFHGERINLCSYADFYEHAYTIDDANKHKLLVEDRPPYQDWFRKVNSSLEVGHRIVANFSGVRMHKSSERYAGDDGRLNPPNAERPDSGVIYTIEKSELVDGDTRFYFYYDRTEERWMDSRWGYRGVKRVPQGRVRCWVGRTDRFMVNIDGCEEDDILYYLRSSRDRQDYENMVPTLKIALEVLQREREEERPFRDLLVHELTRKYKVELSKAEADVGPLIRWWKTRNKTHRALLSDDQKAYRMMLAEYRHVLEREKTAQAGTVDPAVADLIKKQLQKPLLLLARKGQHRVYVTYEISHPWSPQLVDEKEWDVSTSVPLLTKDKPETVVDNRHQRWLIVEQSEHWEGWPRNPNWYKLLTQAHVDAIVQQAEATHSHPIGLVWDHGYDELKLWALGVPADENRYDPRKSPFDQKVSRGTEVVSYKITDIGRNNDGITFKMSRYPAHYNVDPDHVKKDDPHTVYYWQSHQDLWDRSHADYQRWDEERDRRLDQHRYVLNALTRRLELDAQVALRERFTAEYAGVDNADLWEEWLSKRKPEIKTDWLWFVHGALVLAVEKNWRVVGQSLRAILVKVQKTLGVTLGEWEDGFHTLSGCPGCEQTEILGKRAGSRDRWSSLSCQTYLKAYEQALAGIPEDFVVPPAPPSQKEKR
jgi:Fe-S cluster biosynthesis and repair protein YggX